MEQEEVYERVILVKPDVFIYKIPPRTTNRGFRASDWKLDEPDWTGRLRLVAKGRECILKIEDKTSGNLFAKCPVDTYPGLAVESVSDSSRYFVIKIVDDNGRSAFIGIGFADRGDSFDLNVALQDHFKWLQKQDEIEKGEEDEDENQPKLDLKFKEGQTIKVNLNIAKKSGSSRPKAKAAGSGILPPPPGGLKLPGPPGKAALAESSSNGKVKPTQPGNGAPASPPQPQPSLTQQQPSNVSTTNDLLLDLAFDNLAVSGAGADDFSDQPQAPPPQQRKPSNPVNDLWADFGSSPSAPAAEPAAAAPAQVPVPDPVSSANNIQPLDWAQF